METKLNIAEILKDKPKGTKLYTDTFGELSIEDVYTGNEFGITLLCKDGDNLPFYNDGKYSTYGEPILVPSKEMRDWSKFAWKRGDVLINDAGYKIFFDKWENDDYTRFFGSVKVHCYDTEDYTLASKEEAQEFIKSIEKTYGGKFNCETLEIEKPQSEFKDGDIVCISGMGYLAYGIVKSIDYSSKKLEYYVLNDMSTLKFEDWLSFEDRQIQPISETQRMILFDALAKEGKYWDAEKKQVINVKLEIKLQPFDKVLVRDSEDREWRISLFGYKDNSYYYCINGYSWKQCIPYEGNEHLLGTKNNPK